MHLIDYKKKDEERKRIVRPCWWKSAQFTDFFAITASQPYEFCQPAMVFPMLPVSPRCREAIDSQQKAKPVSQCILALIRRTMAQTPNTTTGVSSAKTTPLLHPNGVAKG